ncbi:hypothetical protein BH23PLA1_BH23PLA1_05220 [soil metagenome]
MACGTAGAAVQTEDSGGECLTRGWNGVGGRLTSLLRLVLRAPDMIMGREGVPLLPRESRPRLLRFGPWSGE